MKNNAALITLSNDSFEEISELTHPNIKKYADKIKADFVVIKDKKLSKDYFHYEKFQLKDYFKHYTRILYLDSDIIIRQDCPNLFEHVPEHLLGIYNEAKFSKINYVRIMSEACKTYNIALPKWEGQFYNTGLLVLSRLHRNIFDYPDIEIGEWLNEFKYYEQPYINLKIISEGHKTKDLSYKFNRCSGDVDQLSGEHRLSSFIVHYASAPNEFRLKYINEDLKSWESTSPDFFYKKNILFNVEGGLGDAVDAEPVVRYACEKFFPKDNVKIRSSFPRIFEHLPVTVYNQQKDNEVYRILETMPSVSKPIWQFIGPSLSQTTDFSSISALKRTLPNLDKRIKLKVNEKDIESVKSLVNADKLILIHPGKGWISKTFPAEYWKKIIKDLAEVYGKKVAIIGRYLSNEQGSVDLSCPKKATDLRNLLNLGELIAAISLAEITLSNDSNPIHIAGAFDNWIIMIPTCKHPDHVLPYRYGTQNYKTISLYKKLTCDDIDSSPTNLNEETIDYIKGNIIDYLPDTDDVCQKIHDIIKGNIK